MQFLILVLAVFLFSSSAHSYGWQEVGNGGEGIFCFNDSTTNYHALDYFETTTRYRLKPQLPELEKWDEIETARLIISRLQAYSNLAPLALDLVTKFYSEATFASEDSLPQTQDGGEHVYIPDVCTVIQIAVQRPPSRPEEKHFYTLNQDAWKWMSPTQRGIIIAHEVLYRIAIDFGEPETSEALRYVMALLIADKFQDLSKLDAAIALNRARLWVAPSTPHLMVP